MAETYSGSLDTTSIGACGLSVRSVFATSSSELLSVVRRSPVIITRFSEHASAMSDATRAGANALDVREESVDARYDHDVASSVDGAVRNRDQYTIAAPQP